jgi:protease-4
VGTGRRLILALGLFLILGLIVILVVALAAGLVSQGGIVMGGPRVALLRVEGTISDTSREIDLVRQYTENPHIRAIVVRVDSPGGAVGASQELYEELLKADREKPVIVSFGNTAASGGYYVGLAGRKIIANPGTLTGSIGVLFTHVDLSGLLSERLGVNVSDVTSGVNKDLAAPWRALSPEDRALLTGMLDQVHAQFIGAVRDRRTEAIRRALAAGDASREVTDAEIEAHLAHYCDGRPFTGEQAVKWGFADETGTLQDAIAEAAQAAGIQGEPTIVEWKPRGGLFGPLLRGFAHDIGAAVRQELSTEAPLRYEMRMP